MGCTHKFVKFIVLFLAEFEEGSVDVKIFESQDAVHNSFHLFFTHDNFLKHKFVIIM